MYMNVLPVKFQINLYSCTLGKSDFVVITHTHQLQSGRGVKEVRVLI